MPEVKVERIEGLGPAQKRKCYNRTVWIREGRAVLADGTTVPFYHSAALKRDVMKYQDGPIGGWAYNREQGMYTFCPFS